MKRISVFSMSVLLSGVLLFSACAKDGIDGLDGQKGDKGNPGNANVYQEIFTVNQNQWILDGGVYYKQYLSNASGTAAEEGAVILYYEDIRDGTPYWYALPFSFLDWEMSFGNFLDIIRIEVSQGGGTPVSRPATTKFKLIVIERSQMEKAQYEINVNDYAQVKEYFDLQ